jgi:ABC-type transport system involved in multi-copper enzyme maturation permease subunit
MPTWIRSPVLVYECVLTARRWQTYAVRTAYLIALLVSLALVWWLCYPQHHFEPSRNALAAIGGAFFAAIVGTQLVLVLLAAPAYLAGSVCIDRARGTLTYLLVTHLSDAEIVVGKLGAGFLPVLGLLLAGLPVLVLATLLGGIEPGAVVASFFVTLGVALASATLALAFSVWCRRPHEALLATYFVQAVWLLALPAWYVFAPPSSVTPPVLFQTANPFVLLFSSSVWPAGVPADAYALFVGCTLVASAAFTTFAVLTLRLSARRHNAPGRPRRAWRFSHALGLGPGLDFNPVLCREWHQQLPSRWLRVFWGLYALLSVLATLAALARDDSRLLAAFVNASQFSIGLLLLGVTSMASLFEERVNGSLNVLLTTPLSTASIVRGKWLAGFRVVLLVALLPASLACGAHDRWCAPAILDPERCHLLLGLLFGLLLAYGALVHSLALALATWVRPFGVALGIMVTLYVLLAGVPVLLFLRDPFGLEWLASLSPCYGVAEITNALHDPMPWYHLAGKRRVLLLYSAAVVALVWATEKTFDGYMGRARQRLRPARPPKPVPAR